MRPVCKEEGASQSRIVPWTSGDHGGVGRPGASTLRRREGDWTLATTSIGHAYWDTADTEWKPFWTGLAATKPIDVHWPEQGQ